MPVDTTSTRDLLMRWASQVHEEAAQDVLDELRVAAPVGQTGDTVRGLSVVSDGGPDHPSATVRSASIHGDYVEEGTEPHEIVAHGKALRFLWGGGRISQPGPNQRIATNRGSGVVFFKSVQHPGTPPRPWFDPVVQRWPEFLQRAAAGVAVS